MSRSCLPIHHLATQRPPAHRQRTGRSCGTVHSVVCLQRVARLRPTRPESRGIIIHSGSRPWAFLCRASLVGRTDRQATPAHLGRTHAPPSSTHGANIPHARPEPQCFHLDSSSLGIKLERESVNKRARTVSCLSNKQLIETYCYYKTYTAGSN